MAMESKREQDDVVGDKYAASLASVRAAAERIESYVHKTPVMTSTRINALAGASVFFKCECFQKTGSFKVRGATNAVLTLSDDAASRGITAYSSGNHAQGVAYAASTRKIKAHVVMPDDAPAVKVRAVQEYGATVTHTPIAVREDTVARVVAETGMTEIHSSNNPYVISGQGTMAVEMLEQIAAQSPGEEGRPVVDAVITPVGGGGMLSGVSIASRSLDSRIAVFGAEPSACDDAARSKKAGSIQGNPHSFVTVADGLRSTLKDKTWPIVRDLVEKIFVVSEAEIIAGMRLVWETMKLCIEPSSATAVALVTSDRFKAFAKSRGFQRIGVVLSGGNVDLAKLPWLPRPPSSDDPSDGGSEQ